MRCYIVVLAYDRPSGLIHPEAGSAMVPVAARQLLPRLPPAEPGAGLNLR